MSHKREEEFMIDDLRLMIEKKLAKSAIIHRKSKMGRDL
jgi:hypothetical protein